ncbi:MAG: S41 family peptidase [Planctomycetia bacterium]|nr:S41 family peptidase [Planctomycetia bacterium]
MRKRNVKFLLGAVLIGFISALAFQAIGQEEKKSDLYSEYDRLIRVVHEIRKRYIREVDDDKMFTDAINGMLHGLDQFSSYIPPDKLSQFKKITMGKFSGIGIQIGMRGGRLTVISPLEGTPAFRAGVLAGDVIIEINGISTEGVTLDEAVKKLTGKPGTKVTITVLHAARRKQEEIVITRAVIKIKSVKGFRRKNGGEWEYFADTEHKIAYLRITNFVEQRDINTGKTVGGTVHEMRKALAEIQRQGAKGLILDLRFNPGGLLRSATQTVDLFIEEGIIITRKGRAARSFAVTKATPQGTISELPLVVLLNQYSASGAEIVAGALKDHNRAILIGERSYGKGSVQDVIYLDNGKAALKLTTSKYYLPGGRCIHREKGMTKDDEWGVMPHIAVQMTPEEYAAIIGARRTRDVIHGNGPEPVEEKAPVPKEPEEPEKLEKPSEPKEPEVPKKPEEPKEPLERPEDPGENDKSDGKDDFEDRQLRRALDVLKAMDVMKLYLDKRAAS